MRNSTACRQFLEHTQRSIIHRVTALFWKIIAFLNENALYAEDSKATVCKSFMFWDIGIEQIDVRPFFQ